MKTTTDSSVGITIAQGQMQGVAAVAGGFGPSEPQIIDSPAKCTACGMTATAPTTGKLLDRCHCGGKLVTQKPACKHPRSYVIRDQDCIMTGVVICPDCGHSREWDAY